MKLFVSLLAFSLAIFASTTCEGQAITPPNVPPNVTVTNYYWSMYDHATQVRGRFSQTATIRNNTTPGPNGETYVIFVTTKLIWVPDASYRAPGVGPFDMTLAEWSSVVDSIGPGVTKTVSQGLIDWSNASTIPMFDNRFNDFLDPCWWDQHTGLDEDHPGVEPDYSWSCYYGTFKFKHSAVVMDADTGTNVITPNLDTNTYNLPKPVF